MEFSKKVSAIESSATLDITSKAKAIAASGEDIVILAAGEPDFSTPRAVKEAGIKAINENRTYYTPASGTESLKRAISRKLADDNALKYDTKEIVVSNGAKHSIYNVLQVICNEGDEVLIIPPYWLSYPEMVKLAGAVPKILPLNPDKGFKGSIEDIKSNLTRKTKALIINSPSNPAGVVYEEEELRRIAEICIEEGILIISDEIYEKIIFDGKRHFSIAAVSDKARAVTIVINGVSKSYSMTGWRIGYLAADIKIARLVSNLQSHSTSNPCSISQIAAERALSPDLNKEIERNRKEFERRRNELMDCLEEEKNLCLYKPSGAFYLFCGIAKFGMDSATFCRRLLDEARVAVIPGEPFGHDYCIRLSFAVDTKTLIKGANRIKEWVKGI